MGYSHYWRVPFGEIDLNIWKDLCKDMEKLVEEAGIRVVHYIQMDNDWLECAGADITDECIRYTPDDTESFSLDRIIVRDEFDKEDELYFNCCKTNMRIGDELVTASLILCKYHLGNYITISSDGWDSDFDEGRKLLKKVFPEREFNFKL